MKASLAGTIPIANQLSAHRWCWRSCAAPRAPTCRCSTASRPSATPEDIRLLLPPWRRPGEMGSHGYRHTDLPVGPAEAASTPISSRTSRDRARESTRSARSSSDEPRSPSGRGRTSSTWSLAQPRGAPAHPHQPRHRPRRGTFEHQDARHDLSGRPARRACAAPSTGSCERAEAAVVEATTLSSCATARPVPTGIRIPALLATAAVTTTSFARG